MRKVTFNQLQIRRRWPFSTLFCVYKTILTDVQSVPVTLTTPPVLHERAHTAHAHCTKSPHFFLPFFHTDLYGWPVSECSFTKWLQHSGWLDLSGSVYYKLDDERKVLYQLLSPEQTGKSVHKRLVCVREMTSSTWDTRTYLVYVVDKWWVQWVPTWQLDTRQLGTEST